MSEQVIPKVTIPLLSNNKDMIRIGIEILVLGLICYYFYSKHIKTLKHIEDISQKMEERDDEIDQLKAEIQELRVICNSNHTLILGLSKQDKKPVRTQQPIEKMVIPPPPKYIEEEDLVEEFRTPGVIKNEKLELKVVSLDDELESELQELK